MALKKKRTNPLANVVEEVKVEEIKVIEKPKIIEQPKIIEEKKVVKSFNNNLTKKYFQIKMSEKIDKIRQEEANNKNLGVALYTRLAIENGRKIEKSKGISPIKINYVHEIPNSVKLFITTEEFAREYAYEEDRPLNYILTRWFLTYLKSENLI